MTRRFCDTWFGSILTGLGGVRHVRSIATGGIIHLKCLDKTVKPFGGLFGLKHAVTTAGSVV